MVNLVSVIIPVYNVAPFLRESLDSVINQTYTDLEIIIIDDGSTDSSGLICNEYTMDCRVKVVHQSNGGLSVARNIGLDIFRGDYVTFLDPDDVFMPDMSKRLIFDRIGF
jgi:glycosyltransferase involved in cell wall biosynthesis